MGISSIPPYCHGSALTSHVSRYLVSSRLYPLVKSPHRLVALTSIPTVHHHLLHSLDPLQHLQTFLTPDTPPNISHLVPSRRLVVDRGYTTHRRYSDGHPRANLHELDGHAFIRRWTVISDGLLVEEQILTKERIEGLISFQGEHHHGCFCEQTLEKA